ncbi:MAG: XdhC family protein, partial [Burkholderiales bacterium]|nr:XdhC family protein [Anaerolineae bacterium]
MLDILETVEQWLKERRKVALATVVETWGSAPRGVGSKMAITDETAMIGSVSGGCVEVAVIEEAVAALAGGQPRLLKYGVSDDSAWEVGLTCGGKIAVFVEPLDVQWWRLATDYAQHDRAATTITILEGDHAGAKLLIDGVGAVQYSTFGDLDSGTIANIAAQYTTPQRTDIAGFSVMVDVHRPRPHLIIVGGVHVAQPLQSFARTLGFRVSLIDPRGAFASAERFPDVATILHSYPDKALPQLGLDAHTYLAVLTHDPKIDDGALITALPSPAPYIGVLSSRKTHQARVERLREAGISDELIERISTPIGMDIDAQTPAE